MPLAVTSVMTKGILCCSDHEAIMNAPVAQPLRNITVIKNW